MAKTKEEVEELMKKAREAPCAYPGCDKKQMMTCSLAVLTPLADGRMEPSESMGLGVPFCDYHSLLAMNGMFGVVTDDKLGKQQLHGPFDVIQVVESVFNAQVASGKFQEMMDAMEKAKKDIKKHEKESGINE